MVKATPIRELRRATKTVICPACQQTRETFRVSDPFTASQTARLAAVSVVTAGIPAVSYLRGPRANWLAHYCSSCGIRLLTYIQAGDAVFPLDANALQIPRDSIQSKSSATTLPARVACSPLGPPPTVDFKTLANFANRYRSCHPDQILDVDWNKWYDMPVSFHTMDRTKVYDISFLDFDLDGKLNAVMFFPMKQDPHFLYHHLWAPEKANIRVTTPRNQPPRETGLIQIAQTNWDVGLLFPKARDDGKATDSSPPQYIFRHHDIGHNHLVFSRGHPHFLWSSSEGPLLWTIQRSADGLAEAHTPAEDRLILLDCYDRLVAMEHCKIDARWTKWHTVGRDQVFESYLNLRFYGGLSPKMVDEIVVSYVAISAQLRRKGDWDVVNLED